MRGRGRRNLPSSSSSSTFGSKKLESSRAYKRRAKKDEVHENGVDIISNLPDHILHHIFSFVDLKQAIQTSMLSRRWSCFWLSLPTLKFRYNRNKTRNQFIDFVDRVFMFRNSSDIVEFVLDTNNSIDVTDRLNAWIFTLVIRNVQQVTICTQFPEKFHFHQCLFTCKSLTKLVLKAQSSISLPNSITLPRLKTLFLQLVKFEDEYSTNQLFSNCPILESLTINLCKFLHTNVNISSPLLQDLVIRNCKTTSNALDFQLCAPNLISFDWSNDMSKHCAPKNLSSLVKADISTDAYKDSKLSKKKKAMHAPFMASLLRGLHNVEDLTLSASFLEVVMGAPYLLDSQPTKFCNLRCLKLECKWLSVDYIHAISYLLRISPNIESLFVEVCCMENDYVRQAATTRQATDLLEMQPTQFCNLRCLKMHANLSRDCIYAMACLLKICNNTVTLSYTVCKNFSSDDEVYPYYDEINYDPAIGRDYFSGLSLECLLNNLKCFELCDVTGRINELEFLKFLLKNAMQLEKLLILLEPTYSVDADEERQKVKFTEKVLTFPRASLSVVILFK